MDNDYRRCVLDEIALEGLEGITLDTLWLRLKHRLNFGLDANDLNVRSYLWKGILSSKRLIPIDLKYYELPEPRIPVVYYDRYEHVDPLSGSYLEKEELIPDEPYPLVPVKDKDERGSCVHFDTRKNISDDIILGNYTLDTVTAKYDRNRLVIVASQNLRSEALGINAVDPCIETSDMVYCYLEKIGRGRHLGCVTVGKESSNSTINPKTAFYYRKRLLRRGLIRKASHYVRYPRSHSSTKGYAIYLSRFYQRRLTSLEVVAKRISDQLMQSDDRQSDYLSLKEKLNHSKTAFRHIFANYPKNFHVFTADLAQGLNNKKVKRRFVKLIKPVNYDEDDDEQSVGGEESGEDEDNDAADVNNETVAGSSKDDPMKTFRLYRPRILLADRTIQSQVLMLIETTDSPDGLSLTEIGQRLSLTKLDCRGLVKALEKKNYIKSVKVDCGRTKIAKYIPLSKIDESNRQFALASKALKNHSESETLLSLRRTNLILEYIEGLDVKIVDGLQVLKKVIMDAESGTPHAIDKRSVRTLVLKLHRAGKIKVFETTHTVHGKTHEWLLICHWTIPDESSLIKDRKEQWFFKIDTQYGSKNSPMLKKTMRRLRSQAKTHEELEELQLCENLEYQPSIGRKYGVEPKMRKILTLYNFMHHLLYVLPNDAPGTTYDDWRKHVYPLPPETTPYTCTLGDIIPRMPLAIFVRVVFLTYVIPNLEEYLNDQGKCLETMTMLPNELRQRLFYRRKHMFTLHETFTFMSYLGLVGVDYKEMYPKETLRVTLHNQTEFENDGIIKQYQLNSFYDVSMYGDELMAHCADDHCTNCSLDKRLYAHSHRNWTFTSKFRNKAALTDYTREMLRLTTHTTLFLRDKSVPVKVEVVDKVASANNSQRKGRKRKAVSPTHTIVEPAMKRTRASKAKAMESQKDSVESKNIDLPALPKPKPYSQPPPTRFVQALRPPSCSPTLVLRKSRKKPRKPVAEHRKKLGRQPAYDTVDRAALKLMKKHRVNWNSQEDNFLLLCRVASVLLDPKCPHNICVSRAIIRDELHKNVPSSHDKTGLACQRRVLYMLKDPRTAQNVAEWVAEFKQDAAFSDVPRPNLPRSYEKEWTEAFLVMLDKVVTNFMAPQANSSQSKDFQVSESTIGDYEIVEVTQFGDEKKKEPVYSEPHNIVDVHVSVVDNVLLSTLLLNANESLPPSAFSYALFKIYQRYPDTLIRSVVNKLQKNTIMAKVRSGDKKSDASTMKQRGVTPYKISQHYLFLLQTKFNITELIEGFIQLADTTFEDDSLRSVVAMVTTLFTANNANLKAEVPDNFIILDDMDNKFKINEPSSVDDKRNSSRSLLAFRQHLSSSRGEISSQSLQEILVLASCKVTCSHKSKTVLDEDAFERHLEYMRKAIPDDFSTNANGKASDNFPLTTLIKNQKELGASREQILEFVGTQGWPESVLKKLENDNVIFRLGVKNFRWVHWQYVNPWIVHSVMPGEANGGSEKIIRYIARTWKKPNGDIDVKTVYKFLSGLLGHVMSFPGIKEDEILSHFRITMPGAQALEMIELLVIAKCLTVMEKKLDEKPSLFNDKSTRKLFRFYESTPDCLVLLSQIKQLLCP